MTPRERLLTALGRGIPDRLPAMEMAIDWRVAREAGRYPIAHREGGGTT